MGIYYINRGTVIFGKSAGRASFLTLKAEVLLLGEETRRYQDAALPAPREKPGALMHRTAATHKHRFNQQHSNTVEGIDVLLFSE